MSGLRVDARDLLRFAEERPTYVDAVELQWKQQIWKDTMGEEIPVTDPRLSTVVIDAVELHPKGHIESPRRDVSLDQAVAYMRRWKQLADDVRSFTAPSWDNEASKNLQIILDRYP